MSPKIIKGRRKLYNIHTITTDIELRDIPLDRTVKNLEIQCLRCGFIQIIPIKTAFTNGANCSKCRAKVKASYFILNYRLPQDTIIDNTSIPNYQIGGFRIKNRD